MLYVVRLPVRKKKKKKKTPIHREACALRAESRDLMMSDSSFFFFFFVVIITEGVFSKNRGGWKCRYGDCRLHRAPVAFLCLNTRQLGYYWFLPFD